MDTAQYISTPTDSQDPAASVERVHWLTITVHGAEGLPPAHEQLAGLLWLFNTEEGHGWCGYTHSVRDRLTGTVLAWDMPQNPYHACLSIPGEALAILGTDAVVTRARELTAQGFRVHCSRIDQAVDTRALTPRELYDQAEWRDDRMGATNCDTQAHLWKGIDWHENKRQVAEDGRRGTSGLYIGSPSSDRRLRVYDQHGFTRIELQARGQAAELYFELLLTGTLSAAGAIRDYADFPDWPEWDQAMQSAKPIGAHPYATVAQSATKKLEASAAWIDTQCSRSIAILDAWGRILGRDLLAEILAHGQAKLTPQDLQLLELAQLPPSSMGPVPVTYPRDTRRGPPPVAPAIIS